MSQLDLALEAVVSARHVSSELAIESFFPADAATARALEARSRVRS
jgi:hypothetical protein